MFAIILILLFVIPTQASVSLQVLQTKNKVVSKIVTRTQPSFVTTQEATNALVWSPLTVRLLEMFGFVRKEGNTLTLSHLFGKIKDPTEREKVLETIYGDTIQVLSEEYKNKLWGIGWPAFRDFPHNQDENDSRKISKDAYSYPQDINNQDLVRCIFKNSLTTPDVLKTLITLRELKSRGDFGSSLEFEIRFREAKDKASSDFIHNETLKTISEFDRCVWMTPRPHKLIPGVLESLNLAATIDQLFAVEDFTPSAWEKINPLKNLNDLKTKTLENVRKNEAVFKMNFEKDIRALFRGIEGKNDILLGYFEGGEDLKDPSKRPPVSEYIDTFFDKDNGFLNTQWGDQAFLLAYYFDAVLPKESSKNLLEDENFIGLCSAIGRFHHCATGKSDAISLTFSQIWPRLKEKLESVGISALEENLDEEPQTRKVRAQIEDVLYALKGEAFQRMFAESHIESSSVSQRGKQLVGAPFLGLSYVPDPKNPYRIDHTGVGCFDEMSPVLQALAFYLSATPNVPFQLEKYLKWCIPDDMKRVFQRQDHRKNLWERVRKKFGDIRGEWCLPKKLIEIWNSENPDCKIEATGDWKDILASIDGQIETLRIISSHGVFFFNLQDEEEIHAPDVIQRWNHENPNDIIIINDKIPTKEELLKTIKVERNKICDRDPRMLFLKEILKTIPLDIRKNVDTKKMDNLRNISDFEKMIEEGRLARYFLDADQQTGVDRVDVESALNEKYSWLSKLRDLKTNLIGGDVDRVNPMLTPRVDAVFSRFYKDFQPYDPGSGRTWGFEKGAAKAILHEWGYITIPKRKRIVEECAIDAAEILDEARKYENLTKKTFEGYKDLQIKLQNDFQSFLKIWKGGDIAASVAFLEKLTDTDEILALTMRGVGVGGIAERSANKKEAEIMKNALLRAKRDPHVEVKAAVYASIAEGKSLYDPYQFEKEFERLHVRRAFEYVKSSDVEWPFLG